MYMSADTLTLVRRGNVTLKIWDVAGQLFYYILRSQDIALLF